ncbi:MAG TPA: Gmad2 immunoglobulin-like domain-containing protein [Coriobacteriia bacterium]|nr:Gmad2 immunoglobulin-like domain-containing protein [Coriobacteriia bacterium]
MRTRHLVVPLVAVVVVFAVALAPGCRRAQVVEPPEPPPAAEESEPAPTPPAEEAREVRLYLVRDEKIGVEGTTIPQASETTSLVAESLDALAKQPLSSQRYGLGTAVPVGTEVRGVEMNGRTAIVNLSKEFETGGGSLSMQLRVAQVVYTATQFEDVDRVAFEIEGERVESIGGEGVSVDPPLTRDDCEAVTPAILVEAPVPGAAISSPVTISGTANVFEARFMAKVSDGLGDTLTEQPITATSGTGTRGTFTDDLTFDVVGPGAGSISVYALSPKDGSKTDEIKIPAQLVE